MPIRKRIVLESHHTKDIIKMIKNANISFEYSHLDVQTIKNLYRKKKKQFQNIKKLRRILQKSQKSYTYSSEMGGWHEDLPTMDIKKTDAKIDDYQPFIKLNLSKMENEEFIKSLLYCSETFADISTFAVENEYKNFLSSL